MAREPRQLTYSIDGTPRSRVATGVILALAALVPSVIVVAQWLSFDGLGEHPSTHWGASVVGGTLVLYGLWLALRSDRVTVDLDAGTLTWTRRLHEFALSSETWGIDEVDEVILIESGGRSGCSAHVTGPRGMRTLREYFHSASLPPPELTATARMLGKSLRRRP